MLNWLLLLIGLNILSYFLLIIVMVQPQKSFFKNQLLNDCTNQAYRVLIRLVNFICHLYMCKIERSRPSPWCLRRWQQSLKIMSKLVPQILYCGRLGASSVLSKKKSRHIVDPWALCFTQLKLHLIVIFVIFDSAPILFKSIKRNKFYLLTIFQHFRYWILKPIFLAPLTWIATFTLINSLCIVQKFLLFKDGMSSNSSISSKYFLVQKIM